MCLIVRQSLVLTLLLAAILCGVYPLVVTLAGNALFPSSATGSLVMRHGAVVGSELIGQVFTSSQYFHGRPSAAGESGYDASASSGSNLGPTSTALAERLKLEAARLRAEQGAPSTQETILPVDLLTASASGLDPHITPEAARFQVARVAAERGIGPEQVMSIVERQIEGPELGLFGESRINVLRLNMALDALQ